tara:strand:+ start:794 stop:1162 length:369 start_codon:yes stop_codon:yes gene_type:complete
VFIMAAEQTEKAYQKQLGVNAGCVLAHDFASPRRSRVVSDARRRRIVVFSAPLPQLDARSDAIARLLPRLVIRFAKSIKNKAPGKAGTRYYKSVGLGFKTPREAIEGACSLSVVARCASFSR